MDEQERREVGLARQTLRRKDPRGLTQAELAEQATATGIADVSVGDVRRIEDAVDSIPERKLRACARALGVEFALYVDARVSVTPAPAPTPDPAPAGSDGSPS